MNFTAAPNGSNETLYWARLALYPLLHELSTTESARFLHSITSIQLPKLFAYLHQNRLDQLWREYLSSIECPAEFKPWLEASKKQALALAAQQLKERHALGELHQLLEHHGIPYFIFKGANLRYTLYANPTLRSSCDIDAYVPDEHKYDAIRHLAAAGYALEVKPQNAANQASLTRGTIHIDLHWHLLRPGRLRVSPEPYLFSNRQPFVDGAWGLNRQASLFVMLIHPVFTKHLASPYSMTMHMVDLHHLLAVDEADWEAVVRQVADSGAKAAAWSSLLLLRLLGDEAAWTRRARYFEPGKLRQRYLKLWIENDLVNRWFDRRFVIRGLFSLAMQDRASDMRRALRVLRKIRKAAADDTRRLQEAVYAGK
ncbi:MAG: nucleotidyltransferase family protein [Xanthomonadales bacterium]|jgi:hypothetical protein|nr:nucleotidyltransferase family protein [Xanthomonadales bacterium]